MAGRLRYAVDVAGRSCVRRCVGGEQRHATSFSRAGAAPRPQSRALHYTRYLSKEDDHDSSSRSSSSSSKNATTATTGAAPNALPTQHGDGASGGLSARTALARVGRGCLLALPLAGIGAAAWVGRSDYLKTRQELRLARVRLALEEMQYQRDASRLAGNARESRPSRPTLDISTTRCYAAALMADSGVLAAHLVAAYGLYRGWDPDPIVNAEIAGVFGALLSTGGGVRGEYLVAARSAAEASTRESGGGGGGGDGGGGGGDASRGGGAGGGAGDL